MNRQHVVPIEPMAQFAERDAQLENFPADPDLINRKMRGIKIVLADEDHRQFFSAAKFSDSQRTPSPVAPSPKKLTATRWSSRIFAARAAPIARGMVPPRSGRIPSDPPTGR